MCHGYRLRIETQNPHTAFSSAMGGRDVENTGYAVRPALRYSPSRPKTGRDKTSLNGGGCNRASKGVFKHRVFRPCENVTCLSRLRNALSDTGLLGTRNCCY